MADENVNNYYDEFMEDYIKGEIKGYTKDQIMDAFQDFLVDKGYGRAQAEAAVLYVTNGGYGVDFSDFLDVKPDSKLAAKLASLDVVKTYSNLSTINSYAKIFNGLYDDLNDIEEYRLPDGRYNYEGEKKLESSLFKVMDLSGNLIDNVPGGKIYSIPLSGLQDGIDNAITAESDWQNRTHVGNFILEHDLDGDEGWDNLYENYGDFRKYDSSNVELGEDKDPYKYGPSIEQMEAVFQNNVPDYFDEYISWRVKYEFEQKLRENYIYPDSYYRRMEELEPSKLQKIWNAAKKGAGIWNKTLQKFGETLYDLDSYKQEKSKKIIGDIFNKASSKFWAVNPIISSWKSAGTARYVVDPLIFDLDDDGFNITDKSEGAYFDKDNNGYKERIDWTNTDAFLALDRNGNGKIDNGTELFGDTTYIEGSDEYAENGFAALQQYDENGDGIIDSRDSVYDDLRLWVDANGDGVSEESELSSLAERGIASISAIADEEKIDTGTDAVIDGKMVLPANSAHFGQPPTTMIQRMRVT